MKRMYSWILLLFIALPLCLYAGNQQDSESLNLDKDIYDYAMSRFNVSQNGNSSVFSIESNGSKTVDEMISRTVAGYNKQVEDIHLQKESDAVDVAKKKAEKMGPIYINLYDYISKDMRGKVNRKALNYMNAFFGMDVEHNNYEVSMLSGLNYCLSFPKSSIVWDNSVLLAYGGSYSSITKVKLYTGLGTFLASDFNTDCFGCFGMLSGGIQLEDKTRNNLLYVLPSTKLTFGYYVGYSGAYFVNQIDMLFSALSFNFIYSLGVAW